MRVLLCALAFVTIAASGRAMPITSCGDSVPDGETGDLMNDLTCTDPATGPSGLVVGTNATLNLNGFRITGPGSTVTTGGGPFYGIFCGGTPAKRARTCQVNGPGEVTSFQLGIYAHDAYRAVVNGVSVPGNGYGVFSFAHRLSLMNVVADGNVGFGVAGSKIEGTGIETNDNGEGGMGGSG